ncbi:hypothetical protein EYR38_007369 [Pleurotus pulmonarius]|nr:hypothetical protein EYR38_007369 [Pleurotus pulmonarius]
MFFLKATLLTIIPTLAVALRISAPTNPVSGESTDITWTLDGLPANQDFTIFLMRADDPFGLLGILAEDVDYTLQTVMVTLPDIGPANNLVIKAVQPDWVDFVISTSPAFNLEAAP